jgi:hypothetical protein
VCGPPEFSDTLPPMVLAFWLEGSGARKSYENAALAGERSAGKACAGAAADDRRLITIRDLNDADDVFGVTRENHAIRAGVFDGSIVLVEHQLFGTMQNRVGSQEFF